MEDIRNLVSEFARLGGRTKSDARAAASRQNGRKGGRPAKHQEGPRAPNLSVEALHGPLGDYVKLIEPHTEASAAAILVQGLVLASALLCEHEAVVSLGGTECCVAPMAVIVGRTSSSRKSTALLEAVSLMEQACPGFKAKKTKPISAADLYWEKLIDYDVGHVRLLENTMTSALKRFARQHLPGEVRDLDNALSEPAFSLVGHVVPADLDAKMQALPSFGLLGRHFLWVYTERTRLVPHPEEPDAEATACIVQQLAASINFSKNPMQLDADSLFTWGDIAFKSKTPGKDLASVLKSRAQHHTLTLALIYAMLDRSKVVAEEHIRAAHAVWRYCSDSIDILFKPN